MQLSSFLFPIAFAGMVIGLILFYRLGMELSKRWFRRHGWKKEDFSGIQTSTLGIYALLLGFTFSSVLQRHDDRRKAIIQEANDIQTTILLSDLYDDSNRSFFRKNLQAYLETRIEYFEAGDDKTKSNQAYNNTNLTFMRLWERASALSKLPGYLFQSNQMIPALRDQIEVVAIRDSVMQARLGSAIVATLFIMLIFSSFMMGVASNHTGPHRLRFAVFAFVSLTAIILIIDLNRPHIGMITFEKSENRIVALRKMFG